MWRRIILKRQVKLGAGQSSAHWSALERVGAEEQSQGRGGCLFKRTSKRCGPSSLSRTLLRGHVIILKSLRQIRGVGEEFI